MLNYSFLNYKNNTNKMVVLIILLILGCFHLPGMVTLAEGNENDLKDKITVDSKSANKVAENEFYQLLFEKKEAVIILKDKLTGYEYKTSPDGREDDTRAQGLDKMILASQIDIEYYNLETGSISKSTSYASCVKKSSFKYNEIKDGIEIIYEFEKEQITIPVYFTLDNKSLICGIDTKGISESGENRLLNISFLPYFGAGDLAAKGFIFVPDGSGALIYLNNGKDSVAPYQQEIFGRDESIKRSLKSASTYNVALPVAGISYQEGGLLGVVSQGAGLTNIHAEVSGMKTSYNAFHFSFRLRARDVFILGENNYYSKQVDLFEKGEFGTERYEVRFFPLSKEKNSYVDMAEKYRQYLIEEKGLEKKGQNPSIHLEYWGGIMKFKSILGIPVQTFVSTSKYSDIKDRLMSLHDKFKGDMILSVVNWNKKQANGDLFSKNKASNKLGGNKDLMELNNWASDNNVKLFLMNDLVLHKPSLNLIDRFFKSARNVSGFNSILNSYKRNTYDIDLNSSSYYLAKVDSIKKVTNELIRFSSSSKINGVGILDASRLLYSDFSRTKTNKDELSILLSEEIQRIEKEGISVLTTSPNEYALFNSDFASMTPSGCSNFDIEDDCIPFYQITIRGWIPYSVEPTNLSGSTSDFFLKAIETGGAASFVLLEENYEELQDSPYSFLYGCNSSLLMDEVTNAASNLEELQKIIGDSTIASHTRLIEDVYSTEYSNGVRVIVNYSDNNVSIEEFEILPKNYSIIINGVEVSK